MDYDSTLRELKSRGKRLTPQRMEIIKAILRLSKQHPTLKDIVKAVKKELPTTSVSTTYNTIMELEEIGLLRIFEFNKEIRIEPNSKPHLNIIDPRGIIYDIDDEELIEIIADKLNLKSRNFLVNVLLQNDSK